MKNSREIFDRIFPDPHSFIVALHPESIAHAVEGAEIAINNGAHGVTVITHDITSQEGIISAQIIKKIYPYHTAIVNILERDPKRIMESIIHTDIDGLQVDRAMIKGVDKMADTEGYADYADKILHWQKENGRDKIYFGGFDFKGQTTLTYEEYLFGIEQAKTYVDVITTSGPATGVSADVEKIQRIKQLAGQHPIGLASGISTENIQDYIKNVDISIVATNLNKKIEAENNHQDLDPQKVLELATIIEKYNRKIERKRFEAATLKKYNKSSVYELYTYLNKGDVINIGMSTEYSEEQKILSNLYPSPFVLDGIAYASVEAFRMSIKYPPTDPRHTQIRELSGIKAKISGRDARLAKSLIYQDQVIRIGSPEHHALLKRAIRAKLEQNPEILQVLLATGNKPLTHIVFTRHIPEEKYILHDSKTIPGEKFAQIYTELRNEFRV